MMRKTLALCLAALVCLGAPLDSPAAASVRSHIVWEGDEARLQVTIDPGAVPEKSGERTVSISVEPVNRRGENPGGFVGSHSLKLTGDGKPVTGTFPLLAGGTPRDRLWVSYVRVGQENVAIPGDYVRVSVRDNALGLSSEELIYPFRPGSPVDSCGVRLTGGFDDRKAYFFLSIGPREMGMDQNAALSFQVLDVERNQLSSVEDEIVLSHKQPAVYEKDVTPGRDATGPYTIAFSLDNEVLGMAVASDVRFPFASQLVPVSSMGSDTLADWHIPRISPDAEAARKVPNTLFSAYQPFDRPAFDSNVRRGGARSLRIDYAPTAPATIGSNVRLPGLPVAARIWVKGNNTGDRLVIEWRDPCNFNAATHQRWMNSMASEICRLDFEDWRCFTVPLMGNGLLARDPQAYMAGHTGLEVRHPVQAPLYCAAVRVIPDPSARGAAPDAAVRSVWIDDLMVETQAPRNERMALELRGDTVEARLHADAQLFVTVGNGTGHDIRNGRVSVTFLDADGDPVQDADLADGIDVPAGEFTAKVLPLKALAERNPRGPVTALVTVTGPVIGQRVQGRMVFSRPTGTGLFWDFEKVEHFNPPAPEWYYAATYHRNSIVRQSGRMYISLQHNNKSGPTSAGKWMPAPEGMGADPVAGGADGTAKALPLVIATKLPASVLLHPALPGFPAGVEMQVFGDGQPVFLQALFMDRGSPEFDIPFQQFAAAPVRVDWKGWKECRFQAPPLPPLYTAERGNPFYSPSYPLNLVLTAWTEDGRSAVIRVDQIKVSTHLPRKDELIVDLEYPDESMLHLPGAPLKMVLANLSSEPMALDARYRLTTPVGVTVGEGVCKMTLAPGARLGYTLAENLSEGFYHLRMEGLPDGRAFHVDVQAPDRARFFGDALMARLSDTKGLNADLGLMEKRVNLDWDTAEPVPNLHHHDWFRRNAANESEERAYEIVPIVGYAADWAGPEKQPAVEDGTYTRDVGNYMQTPVRLADWDAFMRTVGREHARDFKQWVFWQSPDIQESPIHLPPEKYRRMFDIFHRWISLYAPDARVIAGGFSFDRVLGYLNGMPEPQTLPFDLFEVRVNPGSVSTEEVQLEDFLEELGARLDLAETGRKVSVVELDWVTDDQLRLLTQAAYHVRAAILLHALGALPHQFASVNRQATENGFGVLFRPSFGNSSIQNQRAFYVPKPAYFGLIETRKMLADLQYLKRAFLADRDPLANRAYLFESKSGGICAAIWRVRDARAYRLPAQWTAVGAVDAFGVPVALDKSLPVGPLPLFLRFADVAVDGVAHGLRNLQPLEGDDPYNLVLDVFVAEAAAAEAAEYKATGGDKVVSHPGRLYAGERVYEGFLEGVTEERFAFTLDKAGDVLMSRLWHLDAAGETNRTMRVVLNGGSAQTNNLAPAVGLASTNNVDKVYVSGPRRSAFVLRGCRAGRNEVVLLHDAPTVSGGFRLTRIVDGRVDLTSCGPLACLDSGVPVQAFRNAAGSSLSLGKQSYASGIGCMGRTALEYPLNKQFSKFEVTVGIDAVTRGRGSVAFRILVDGVEKKASGMMTGMTIPKTLSVEDLDNAERLLLWVDDGGDGADNDLANWCDPILHVRRTDHEDRP